MPNYPDNIYFIESEDILELSRWNNSQVGNVVRGLYKECFVIISEDNLKTIRFDYINGENELRGRGVKINFKDDNFYDELLLFSNYLSNEFGVHSPVGIYDTFTEHLRTILEQNDYFTFRSSELSKYNDGILIGKQKIEIIKSIKKRDFFKLFLESNEIKIKENTNYLYLMLNERTDLFKIGYSKTPKYREKTLQSEEPEIFTLKIWECDKSVEREMHKLFEDKRIRGEWFKLNVKDIIELNQKIKNYS